MKKMYETIKNAGKKALLGGLASLVFSGCLESPEPMTWADIAGREFDKYVTRNGAHVYVRECDFGFSAVIDQNQDGNPESMYSVGPKGYVIRKDTDGDGRMDETTSNIK